MPVLVLVGGLPGSGKTAFATELARALRAQHISSDQTRRDAGLRGQYSREAKQMVYAQMLENCKQVLAREGRAVIDSTFSSNTLRRAFEQLAIEMGIEVLFVRVWAAESVIRERMQQNRPDSEADFSVYTSLREQSDPLAGDLLSLRSDHLRPHTMASICIQYLKSRGYGS